MTITITTYLKTGATPERMIELTKNYKAKMAEKMLSDYELYKSSVDYYKGLLECDNLPFETREKAAAQVKYQNHIISSIERALSLLDKTEREIIDKLYFRKELSFYDICEECGLERSSIYRHRTNALSKIATAIYGADDIAG